MPKNNLDNTFQLVRTALAASSIDAEARTIEGYIVIEKGELRDYREYIVDDKMMEQLEELGNASEGGIKVRWTHPDFFADHLGKYLGRATNFRIDGDALRADMKFAEAASLAPTFTRDPVAYILALAKEDPKAFATSVHFMADRKAMAVLAEDMEDCDPVPLRVKEFTASDIVDEGAAASSFLSKQSASPDDEAKTKEAKENQMAKDAKEMEADKALARDEANRENNARLVALKAEFPDNSEFVLEQFAAGNDVTQAKAEYSEVLKTELAASKAETEAAKTAEAEAKEQLAKGKGKKDGPTALNYGDEPEGDEGGEGANEMIEQLMSEGKTRAQAIRLAHKKFGDSMINLGQQR